MVDLQRGTDETSPQSNKPSTSSALGWLVSVGAIGGRAPQLYRILKNNSVDGLEPTLFMADVVCNTVSAVYHRQHGYPLNTFGETIAFTLQSLSTVWLISTLSPSSQVRRRTNMFIAAYLLGLGSLGCAGDKSRRVVDRVQSFTMIGLQLSRLPQIYKNQMSRCTGQLSIIPWIVNGLGSSARLYTTMKLLDGNVVMVRNFSLSILINIIMAVQIATFGGSDTLQSLKA
eukprot:m.24322 g.24322  ORF g.24322 m.24322 type:complete len:229 (+) comp14551_c0_seq2:432-1118(+)